MHKVYIVTNSEIISQHLHNLGLITPPPRAANLNTPIRPRPPRPGRPDREEIRAFEIDRDPPQQTVGLNVTLVCSLYLSKDEALEAITELSRHNMNQKWYLLESIAFIEVPPTQPVIKKWNNEGELLDTAH